MEGESHLFFMVSLFTMGLPDYRGIVRGKKDGDEGMAGEWQQLWKESARKRAETNVSTLALLIALLAFKLFIVQFGGLHC